MLPDQKHATVLRPSLPREPDVSPHRPRHSHPAAASSRITYPCPQRPGTGTTSPHLASHRCHAVRLRLTRPVISTPDLSRSRIVHCSSTRPTCATLIHVSLDVRDAHPRHLLARHNVLVCDTASPIDQPRGTHRSSRPPSSVRHYRRRVIAPAHSVVHSRRCRALSHAETRRPPAVNTTLPDGALLTSRCSPHLTDTILIVHAGLSDHTRAATHSCLLHSSLLRPPQSLACCFTLACRQHSNDSLILLRSSSTRDIPTRDTAPLVLPRACRLRPVAVRTLSSFAERVVAVAHPSMRVYRDPCH